MIVDKISSQAGLARFASFTYESKSTGEVARYTIQLGFSYRNCLEKSKLALEIESAALNGLDKQAAEELLNSFVASLNGTQENYTKQDIYADVTDSSGKTVQGIKRNISLQCLSAGSGFVTADGRWSLQGISLSATRRCCTGPDVRCRVGRQQTSISR